MKLFFLIIKISAVLLLVVNRNSTFAKLLFNVKGNVVVEELNAKKVNQTQQQVINKFQHSTPKNIVHFIKSNCHSKINKN